MEPKNFKGTTGEWRYTELLSSVHASKRGVVESDKEAARIKGGTTIEKQANGKLIAQAKNMAILLQQYVEMMDNSFFTNGAKEDAPGYVRAKEVLQLAGL